MTDMPPFAPPEFYSTLGAAAASTGGSDFYLRLMHAIGSMLKADLSMVMRYSHYSAPVYVIHEGLSPNDMDIYLGGLYRVDPVYRRCREADPQGVYNLADVCTPEERAGEYFSIFLRLTGMADDLVILLPAPAGRTIGLVYERSSAFTREEVESLRGIYPLIGGMHAGHERLMLLQQAVETRPPIQPFSIVDHVGQCVFESVAWRDAMNENADAIAGLDLNSIAAGTGVVLGSGVVVHVEPLGAEFDLAPSGFVLMLEQGTDGLPPINYRQALEDFLRGKLTPRERDIVRLILLGLPTVRIAEQLDISVNTVKNHRKRMYYKLDITTERELFMNFVRHLFHTGCR